MVRPSSCIIKGGNPSSQRYLPAYRVPFQSFCFYFFSFYCGLTLCSLLHDLPVFTVYSSPFELVDQQSGCPSPRMVKGCTCRNFEF